MTAKQQVIAEHLAEHDQQDDDAAAAELSQAELVSVGRVTFTTMARRVGAAKVAGFINQLDTIAGGPPHPLRGMAKLASAVLGNDGLDPADQEAAASVAALVKAGLLTAADAQRSQFDLRYPAGEPVSGAEVAAVRALQSRQRAAFALDARVHAAASTFLNEALFPALARGDALPTWSDFAARIAAEAP